nr:MAG TPA: hypothetical protein [Caudoviricetes sp.]
MRNFLIVYKAYLLLREQVNSVPFVYTLCGITQLEKTTPLSYFLSKRGSPLYY